MQRQGIEVKRDTHVGLVMEKTSWLNIAAELYPRSERIYYPNDQDHVVHTLHDGVDVAFIAGQGSPMAACMTERLRVYGALAIARIGTCGALSNTVKLWNPIITTGCFSSEGTSGHYLPKGFPITSDPGLDNAIREQFKKRGVDWQEGLTVTTDGRWREDPALLKELHDLGIVSIEMETAAILAVCRFRKIIASAINLPADLPVEHSTDDFKGLPNRETYDADLRSMLLKITPAVVDALVSTYKKIITTLKQ